MNTMHRRRFYYILICIMLFLVMAISIHRAQKWYINYSLTRVTILGNINDMLYYLANGADVNNDAYHGLTPLRAAVYYHHDTAIAILLDHGANPNDALFKAIQSEDKKLLVVLLDHGANPFVKQNKTENTAYETASPNIKNFIHLYSSKRQ